jgi:hypothetical protein
MLTATDIRTRARRQPFEPFRIMTSSGESFDVTHPDLIMVGNRDVVIGIPGPENPTVHDQIAQVSILHITSIRNLPPVTPPSANGPV